MAAIVFSDSDSDSDSSLYGFSPSDIEDFELSDTDSSDADSDEGGESPFQDWEYDGSGDRWIRVRNLQANNFDQTVTGVPRFSEHLGPRNIPPGVERPADYIRLLLGEQFSMELVGEINRYSAEKAQRKLHQPTSKNQSQFRKWRHTNIVEVRAFLELIINMGLIQKNRLNEYWSTLLSQQTLYFATVMTRDRFLMLLSMFHNKEGDVNLPGRAHKVTSFINNFINNFQAYYYPEKEMSVDESLVGFQRRAPAMQYMPNKHHHKFGIKLWNLCESSTGYTCNVQMYAGRSYTPSENGLGYDVCMSMMAPYISVGHHLYVDNFFSSIPLAEDLLKEKIYPTGTLRSNRRGIPNQVKIQQKKGDFVAARKGPFLCVNFHDKKPVMFITSNDTAVPITYLSKRNRERHVPNVTFSYNQHMGGVDMSDMRTYMFLDDRRSVKWTTTVFFFMFGRLTLNAFIIYQKHATPVSSVKLDRRSFLIQAVEGLVGDYREIRRLGRPLMSVEDRLTNPTQHLTLYKDLYIM